MKRKSKCRECGASYIPVAEIQLYCSRTCKNRAANRRLRFRAKQYSKEHSQRLAVAPDRLAVS